VRWLLGALGVLLAGYGGWLLVSREDDLVDVAVWLLAGVVLHDAVLALVTVALGALAVRLVPAPARAPVVVGFVVLGSATLFAVPVLGRFGARGDNPSLLDRDYTAGWLVLAGLTVLAVVAAALVRSRKRSGRR
jgi:hypothetical protein